MIQRYEGYTLDEARDALESVVTARRAAEVAQSYSTGLGQQKAMAELSVLYEREDSLRRILAALEDMAQAAAPTRGPHRNYGIYAR